MRLIPFLLLLAACSHPQTRWLALSLDGNAIGQGREEVSGEGSGSITRSSYDMHFGRLGASVEMATDVTAREDGAGHLVSQVTKTTLSKQATTSEVTFDGATATVRESAGGEIHTRTVALSEPLFGPEAMRRRFAARLAAPGDTISIATWSATLAAPDTVRATVLPDGRVAIEADGAKRIARLDRQGREQRSESVLPFGTLVAEETGSAKAVAPAELPADFFARTLLRSNVRLPRPRSLDRLVVRVGDQAITVERPAIPPEGTAETPVDPAFLGASSLIDPSDAQIRALAVDIVGDEGDPWRRALRLERWVSEHMRFDAGIGFAPAAELVRDRHGTCAGYAVLLASLLRAAGVPSRLVLGVVYVGGIFGGHAWVEAHVRGGWLPLDAAVLGEGGLADAARIPVARDAMDSGPGAPLAELGRFFGRPHPVVVGYSPPSVTVAADTEPYRASGNRYENAGLGLGVTSPPGARFTHLDAVWPDATLFVLEAADASLTFEERSEAPTGPCAPLRIAGRTACATADGFNVRDGTTVYVARATGTGASRLIDAIATSLTLE